jgi:hypothetical protein
MRHTINGWERDYVIGYYAGALWLLSICQSKGLISEILAVGMQAGLLVQVL